MLPVFVQAAPRWRVLFGPLNVARSDFPRAGGRRYLILASSGLL
jgi:hypothetical protein